jgi:hypothetical protein
MVAIRHYAAIRDAAAQVARSANGAVDALVERRIEQEPAFTDRMLGRIESAMDGYVAKGIRWSAKTLTDRGRNSQESEFGADFAGVLNIDLPDFSIDKGFLAQAKIIEPKESIAQNEINRMVSQCERMLRYTPDAFLFLYSLQGISVVPAVSIVSAHFANPHEFYARSISRFYEEHFECFVGDRAISSPDPEMLETLRERFRARALLSLSAQQSTTIQ